MIRKPGRILLILAVGLALAIPADAYAHWCSNIYQTYARIVVKPERQIINVPDGQTGELKVRVRNNFPYTCYYIMLRVTPPPELNVTVSPTEAEAGNIRVYAGQEVTFTLTITRNGAGSDDISVLNLEVRPRLERLESWRDMDDWWVDQNYTESEIRNKIQNDAQQTQVLLNEDLAKIDSCPGCELDGVTELMGWWGSINGSFEDGYGVMFVAAGAALAVRLQYMSSNNPSRAAVVQSLVDEMDNTSDTARGIAAFLAAYGGSDAAAVSRINTMASSDSSPSAVRMAKAAQLILGDNTTADVTACYQDGNEETRARVVCAVALAIMGDDTPITDYVLGVVTWGADGNTHPSQAEYMVFHQNSILLQLAVFSRRGGPDGVGVVSFLDEEVVVDNVAPAAPTGLTVQPI